MARLRAAVLVAAILSGGIALPAVASDNAPPPIFGAPVEQVYAPPAVGGWYIRGDIDYHWVDFGGADYILYGEATGQRGKFDEGELKGAMSLGAGIGYQINDYFRVDLTGDYFFEFGFRGQHFRLLPGRAVYFGRPLVDAGVPAAGQRLCRSRNLLRLYALCRRRHRRRANVKWDTLVNTDLNGTFEHEGGSAGEIDRFSIVNRHLPIVIRDNAYVGGGIGMHCNGPSRSLATTDGGAATQRRLAAGSHAWHAEIWLGPSGVGAVVFAKPLLLLLENQPPLPRFDNPPVYGRTIAQELVVAALHLCAFRPSGRSARKQRRGEDGDRSHSHYCA